MSLIKLANTYRQSDPKATFYRKAEDRAEIELGGFENTYKPLKSKKMERARRKPSMFDAKKTSDDYINESQEELKLLKAKMVKNKYDSRADKAFTRYNKYKSYIRKRNLKRGLIGAGIGLAGLGAAAYLYHKNKENKK